MRLQKKYLCCYVFFCINITTWGQTTHGLEIFRKAQDGDANAQFELSECYQKGNEGFKKNRKRIF